MMFTSQKPSTLKLKPSGIKLKREIFILKTIGYRDFCT